MSNESMKYEEVMELLAQWKVEMDEGEFEPEYLDDEDEDEG